MRKPLTPEILQRWGENAAENKSSADSVLISKFVRKIFTSDEDAALRSSINSQLR